MNEETRDCINCSHFHDLDVYDGRGNLIHTEPHFLTRKDADGNAVFYWPVYSPFCEYCEKMVKRMKDIEK